jgi:hypothetical protein
MTLLIKTMLFLFFFLLQHTPGIMTILLYATGQTGTEERCEMFKMYYSNTNQIEADSNNMNTYFSSPL